MKNGFTLSKPLFVLRERIVSSASESISIMFNSIVGLPLLYSPVLYYGTQFSQLITPFHK